jgi:HEAT repeat protein
MELYSPKSDFLNMVANDEVNLEGEFGYKNLSKLIALMKDDDRSNRDWAAFLLSQTDLNTPEVRDALISASNDEDFDVRSEAICGMCKRKMPEALPALIKLLAEDGVGMMGVEAAGILADQALLPQLYELRKWWDVDVELLEQAITACETVISTER